MFPSADIQNILKLNYKGKIYIKIRQSQSQFSDINSGFWQDILLKPT